MAKAIDVAERLVKLGKEKQRVEIAHFYCELALQAMGSDDLDRAMSLLKRADAADKQCARVSIMFGRIYMAQNDYAKAAESLQRVLSQIKSWSAKRCRCCRNAMRICRNSSTIGLNSLSAAWKRIPVPLPI